jgi:hypothetical protein
MSCPRFLFLAPLILLAASSSYPQSLVINHDFETLTSTLPGWCPSSSSQIFLAAGWQTPAILITPDYFHACGTFAYSVPSNVFGTEPDNAGGQGYASIIAFHSIIAAREYVQAPLKAPLVAGVTYEVSFDVSLAERSGIAIDRLGAFLGEDITTTGFVLNELPQVTSTSMISNPVGWTTISGQFVAGGGEEFITIGDFGPQPLTNTIIRTGFVVPDVAFYYVDNVIVQPLIPDGRAYVTTFNNELLAVDLDAGATCGVTIVGTTQDTSGGPIREIRGLAFDGKILWGMTHEGDLVKVNPYSAETEHVYTLSAGNQSDEYWNSLAFDGTNTLFTANRGFFFTGYELVALSIASLPPTETLIGTPSWNFAQHPLGPMAMYPPSAPINPPTFDGLHPAPGLLYGQSNLGGLSPFSVSTTTAEISMLYPFLPSPFEQHAFQFEPTNGYLTVLHDIRSVPNSEGFSHYEFDNETFTSLCSLPLALGAPATIDTLGLGLAFLPETMSVDKKAVKLCVSGVSTGIGWSWWLESSVGDVVALSASAPATDIAAAFVQSLKDHGFRAYVDRTDPDCLNVLTDPAALLSVGLLGGSPSCTVTNNPSGCTVNPTIIEAGYLPVFHPVSTDSPAGLLLSTLEAQPNPFNPVTTIRFSLSRAAVTHVEIFDLRGARVRVLASEAMPAGTQELVWNGKDDRGGAVASGVYLVQVLSEGERRSMKLALLK